MGIVAIEPRDVVLVRFPHSNLKGFKLRPALVVGLAEFGNLILCQITSQAYTSKSSLELRAADFEVGQLPSASFIRPDKLFTADRRLVTSKLGTLDKPLMDKVKLKLLEIFDL